MNPDIKTPYVRVRKTFLLLMFLILAAVSIGWWIGQSKTAINDNPSTDTSSLPTTRTKNNNPSVKSLVSYSLPDGWTEGTCPVANSSVYVTPAGSPKLDCTVNPSSLVKISVDPTSNTDCNQLQTVQNVTKHICISEYINGRKSLKAETIYNKESSYQTATAVNAYYIDTGNGVIKVEYVRASGNSEFLIGLEQLAKSTRVK